MAHDVFISYSSKDKTAADALCSALESARIRCWIAPRDVIVGKSYGGQLARAIKASKAMVLIFSEHANGSTAVLAEIELAANAHLDILNFRVDATPLGDDLLFYLQHRHWLDALTPPMERHHAQVVKSLRALLGMWEVQEQSRLPMANSPDSQIDIAYQLLVPAKARDFSAQPKPIALWKRVAMMCALIVGVAAAVSISTDDAELPRFVVNLAMFCLGCGNAIRQMFNDEAMPKVWCLPSTKRFVYVSKSLLVLGALTVGEGALFYVCLWIGERTFYPDALARGVDGSLPWQLGSMIGTAYAAVAIGLAISSFARSLIQAVVIVPLMIIPLILFSGFVIEPRLMPSATLAITRLMPSYAAQTMMDVGLFWNQPITGDLYLGHERARAHLQYILFRELSKQRPTENSGSVRNLARKAFGIGEIYDGTKPGLWAAIKLLAWIFFGWAIAGLRHWKK